MSLLRHRVADHRKPRRAVRLAHNLTPSVALDGSTWYTVTYKVTNQLKGNTLAREIDSLAPRSSGRTPKYDWDTILDGTARAFVPGDDFDCKPESFVGQARNVASDRNVKIATRVLDDEVQVQAILD